MITNAYKSTLTVNQLGKKKNEIIKPNSKRLKKNDGSFMKTVASAGRIETLENYNTQTPSSNCSESSAATRSSTFSQNAATKNS